jgi:ribonucleoside-diphosphate reductase alpha chain
VKAVDDMSRNSRRLGLGIMGFADMLYQLHIGYDSPEGYAMAENVMRTIQEEAHRTSQDLAKEKGVFPLYDLSIYKKLGSHAQHHGHHCSTDRIDLHVL